MKEQERKKLAAAKVRAKKAAEEKAKLSGGEKSCFGHRLSSQSGQLDELFFKGTTIKAAIKKIDSSETRVMSHISHLRKDCSIAVEKNKNGVYKICPIAKKTKKKAA